MSSINLDSNKAKFLDNFRENLNNAKILDNRYPVQGSYILLPYGLKLKQEIFSKFRKTFESNLMAQTVEIPIRIPQDFLKFHSSNEKLEESPNYQEQHFLITPEDKKIDSQPIFRGALDLGLYSLCKQTIRSFKNLPQTWLTQGKVLRKDSGILLARDPEIEFLEGITVINPNKNDHLSKMFEILSVMTNCFNFFGIPVQAVWKPSSVERYNEYKTIKLFTNVPNTNALISIGIIHYFHNYPMKTLNLKVQNELQENFFPTVINWGITQRALFAYLIHNMDEMGFHFSPKSSIYILALVLRAKEKEIADVKIKLDPYLKKLSEYAFFDYSDLSDIKNRLITSEAQGIPIRLEVGLNDLSENKIKLFIRKTREKILISPNELKNTINKYLMLIKDYYDNDFISKEDILASWEENGLVSSTILCTICQEGLEKDKKLLGRDISESNKVGRKECKNCIKRIGVKVYFGNTW